MSSEEDLSCFLTQQNSSMAQKSASIIEAKRRTIEEKQRAIEAQRRANRDPIEFSDQIKSDCHHFSEEEKALMLDIAVNLAQSIFFD